MAEINASDGLVANNRQLHQREKDRIKQLAKGDAKAEERLTAAACALVKCYAEYATGSGNYERAAALAAWGNAPELAAERQIIAQQQGLFSYSTSDKLQDFGKWTGNTAIQTGKDAVKLAGQIATHGPNALPQTPPDLPSDDRRPPSGTAGAVVTPAIPVCVPPVCILTPPVAIPTNAIASTGSGGSGADKNSSSGAGNSEATSPVGVSGSPMTVPRGTNVPTIIDGVDYSAHAIDQMQGRGITPSVVRNTIQNGSVYPTGAGTTGYYDSANNVRVITNSNTGRVVTVIPGAPAK